MAELAYAYGLGPYGETLGGSTPSVRKQDRDGSRDKTELSPVKGHFPIAGVTQLVECHVANVIVAGSNPVSRSIKNLLVVNF